MTDITSMVNDILHNTLGIGVHHFIVTIGDTSMKIASTSPLGADILDAIKAGEAGTTSEGKMHLAIVALSPTIEQYLAAALIPVIEVDVETVARLFIEHVLAQIKTTGPLTILKTLSKVVIGKVQS